MATIFPGSASVGQIFEGYEFNGTAWDIIGINLTADYLETSAASAIYLDKVSASSTYLTQSHESISSEVHGVSGLVVGTTSTQTLTNKTLTSPIITGSGFDAWTSYTPTFTGLDGDGTYTTSAKYQRIGKTVTGRVKVTIASGTPINGSVTFTLPFTTADSTHIEGPMGLCGILDFGSQYYPGYTYGASTTSAIVYVGNSSSTYFLVNGLSSSVPMTWTTNDFFSAQFTYEAA
jgi:hypothetical protein